MYVNLALFKQLKKEQHIKESLDLAWKEMFIFGADMFGFKNYGEELGRKPKYEDEELDYINVELERGRKAIEDRDRNYSLDADGQIDSSFNVDDIDIDDIDETRGYIGNDDDKYADVKDTDNDDDGLKFDENGMPIWTSLKPIQRRSIEEQETYDLVKEVQTFLSLIPIDRRVYAITQITEKKELTHDEAIEAAADGILQAIGARPGHGLADLAIFIGTTRTRVGLDTLGEYQEEPVNQFFRYLLRYLVSRQFGAKDEMVIWQNKLMMASKFAPYGKCPLPKYMIEAVEALPIARTDFMTKMAKHEELSNAQMSHKDFDDLGLATDDPDNLYLLNAVNRGIIFR